MAKEIITLHGGEVLFKSELGKLELSSVRFQIPLQHFVLGRILLFTILHDMQLYRFICVIWVYTFSNIAWHSITFGTLCDILCQTE